MGEAKDNIDINDTKANVNRWSEEDSFIGKEVVE